MSQIFVDHLPIAPMTLYSPHVESMGGNAIICFTTSKQSICFDTSSAPDHKFQSQLWEEKAGFKQTVNTLKLVCFYIEIYF